MKGRCDVTRVLCMCPADRVTLIILTLLTVSSNMVFGAAKIVRPLEFGRRAHTALPTMTPKMIIIARTIETSQTLRTAMTVTVVTMRTKRPWKTLRFVQTVRMTC